MNYLPSKEEILPLKKDSLFSESGFKCDFDSLESIKKLQIINDIIRQTILPDSRPDITTHTDTMIGNCHTSVLCSIDYLKKLNIGSNYRYVFARIKPYEPDDVLSKHAILLLDEGDKTYQFDPSPFVGYKYGSVDTLDNRFYKDYIVISEEAQTLLFQLLDFLYKENVGLINKENIKYYNTVFYESLAFEELHAYSYSCAKRLINYQDNEKDKQRILEVMKKINKYCKLREDFKENMNKRMQLLLKQIDLWKEELNDLIASKSNYKRQLDLIQSITQEQVYFDSIYEKKVLLDGKTYHMSHMNPRFFYEHGLSVTNGELTIQKSDFNCNNCLLFSQAFEGHQSMTKYMYPNIKLNGGIDVEDSNRSR